MCAVNYLNAFRVNLRAAIDAEGLSLRDAADRCGITFAYLHRILSGKVSPSLEICDKIADAMKIELPDMLEKRSTRNLTSVA